MNPIRDEPWTKYDVWSAIFVVLTILALWAGGELVF